MVSGFRYARHSDEPLKQKTLGVRPSCFPGLISTEYIHPDTTQILPGKNRIRRSKFSWLAGIPDWLENGSL